MASMAFEFGRLLEDVPKGAWVAISHDQDRVLCYGSDLTEVIEEAHQLGDSDPIVTKVPQSQNALAF
jgi:hypothetical protein